MERINPSRRQARVAKRPDLRVTHLQESTMSQKRRKLREQVRLKGRRNRPHPQEHKGGKSSSAQRSRVRGPGRRHGYKV